MKTFIKPKDLFVEENNSEYILKRDIYINTQ